MVQKVKVKKSLDLQKKKQLQTPTKSSKVVNKIVASKKPQKKETNKMPTKLLPASKFSGDENESDESDTGMELNLENQEEESGSEDLDVNSGEDEDDSQDEEESNDLLHDEASEDEESDDSSEPGDNDPDSESEDDPVEERSTKENVKVVKTESSIPQIILGDYLPEDVPRTRIVYLKNLPSACQQNDIIKVFSKYGQITHIALYPPKSAPRMAHVAFATDEAACASLEADEKASINGSLISVKLKSKSNKNLSVFVGNVSNQTTLKQVEKHFEQCGQILSCTRGSSRDRFALIHFTKEESVESALQLNGSNFNGNRITVKLQLKMTRDPKRTITIKNTKKHESYDSKKVHKIFEKFGKIESIEMLCTKNVFGFVTFKEEQSAIEALQLNGKTVDDLELELELYKVLLNTNVVMTNVKKGVTEEEIRKFFENTGAIENINLRPGVAFIKFEDADGFCKSFLLHQKLLQDQPIYLEPISYQKPKNIHNRPPGLDGKRPPGGKQPFGPGGKRPFGPGGKRPFTTENKRPWTGKNNTQQKRPKQDN